MRVDSIRNGAVIDHITAGNGMKLYEMLRLGSVDVPVALMMNVTSSKMGRKDIIKIDGDLAIDFDVIGFVDPDVTVNIIKDGALVEKRTIEPPETLKNVIRCRNPRCITSCEQELPHIFRLTDRENKIYRCIYCETKA